MRTVRTHLCGDARIAGDDPDESVLACEARDLARELPPPDRVSVPQHHHAAARQRADRRQRIGDPYVVSEEHEAEQTRLRPRTELSRQPCQLRPLKVIRQPMSSPLPPNSPAAANLADILARIEAARKAALKPAPATTLVAISKGFGAEAIRPVLAAGQRVFGENRVQEAKAKWPSLRAECPNIQLHLVGPLQTNKAREAVALFDAIHSLDRPKLAEALRDERARTEKKLLLFIQVNTGEEPQKAGVLPLDAPKFITFCRETLALPIFGLMCIPPVDQPPAPHFALLAKLAREHCLEGLSMGMSADFEIAIRFGATQVRVGTAIFGEREM